MTKLTDSQLVVLSIAAARGDGAADLPPRMMKAAAMKVGASLIGRKLMREMRAKPGMPVWRTDDDGRGISLVITKAGLKAIKAEEGKGTSGPPTIATRAPESTCQDDHNADLQETTRSAAARCFGSHAAVTPTKRHRDGKHSLNATEARRAGSKQSMIIEMLSGQKGATLDAIIAVTGWLPHTTRAMLTGLRKKGFALERLREDGVTTYRITGQPDQAGA